MGCRHLQKLGKVLSQNFVLVAFATSFAIESMDMLACTSSLLTDGADQEISNTEARSKDFLKCSVNSDDNFTNQQSCS